MPAPTIASVMASFRTCRGRCLPAATAVVRFASCQWSSCTTRTESAVSNLSSRPSCPLRGMSPATPHHPAHASACLRPSPRVHAVLNLSSCLPRVQPRGAKRRISLLRFSVLACLTGRSPQRQVHPATASRNRLITIHSSFPLVSHQRITQYFSHSCSCVPCRIVSGCVLRFTFSGRIFSRSSARNGSGDCHTFPPSMALASCPGW